MHTQSSIHYVLWSQSPCSGNIEHSIECCSSHCSPKVQAVGLRSYPYTHRSQTAPKQIRYTTSVQPPDYLAASPKPSRRPDRSEADPLYAHLRLPRAAWLANAGRLFAALTVARSLRSRSPLRPLQPPPRRLARQVGLTDLLSKEPLEGVADRGRRTSLEDRTIR